jgi:hypothetical protein
VKTVCLLAASLLSGCFLAPAMKLDEDAAVRRGRDKTRDEEF